jgi:hypothetical protein
MRASAKSANAGTATAKLTLCHDVDERTHPCRKSRKPKRSTARAVPVFSLKNPPLSAVRREQSHGSGPRVRGRAARATATKAGQTNAEEGCAMTTALIRGPAGVIGPAGVSAHARRRPTTQSSSPCLRVPSGGIRALGTSKQAIESSGVMMRASRAKVRVLLGGRKSNARRSKSRVF